MSRVSFLFGAGADSVFGISTGKDFMQPLLTGKYQNKIAALCDTNSRLLYHSNRRIYIDSIIENEEEASKVFCADIICGAKTYYDNDPHKKDDFDKACKKWYKDITDRVDNSQCQFFYEYASFLGSLDEGFNDLRKPILSSKGKRIVNTYYTIFVEMIDCLYGLPEKDKPDIYDYFLVLKEKKYKCNLSHVNYYSLIKDEKDWSVNTTNYTSILSEITKKTVGYLHGNLCWFENYRTLEVFDVGNTDIDDTKHIFPFIMLSSGVKPVVCRKQIEQYCKFIKDLNNADVLVVVGYKFNSEDNDVNSIIAEWIKEKNHIMYFFNFEKSTDIRKCSWIVTDSIEDVDDIDDVSGEKSVVNIHVEQNNIMSQYSKLLGKLK